MYVAYIQPLYSCICIFGTTYVCKIHTEKYLIWKQLLYVDSSSDFKIELLGAEFRLASIMLLCFSNEHHPLLRNKAVILHFCLTSLHKWRVGVIVFGGYVMHNLWYNIFYLYTSMYYHGKCKESVRSTGKTYIPV